MGRREGEVKTRQEVFPASTLETFYKESYSRRTTDVSTVITSQPHNEENSTTDEDPVSSGDVTFNHDYRDHYDYHDHNHDHDHDHHDHNHDHHNDNQLYHLDFHDTIATNTSFFGG